LINVEIALSNYEAGRRLEYRVRDMFRRSGFFVIRAAQSKPIDLVCLRKGRSVLVECKAGTSFLGEERRRELLELGERAGAAVVLARRRHRKVELTNLDDGSVFEPENLPDL
jgi:Holliday junction resolvase